MTKARGLRDHNPFNLESLGIQWHGITGTDGPYLIFDTDLNGLRAGFRDLHVAQAKHGFKTTLDFTTHFAPKEDGNDPVVYAKAVCHYAGIEDDAVINTSDPAFLQKWGAGFIRVEQGQQPYPAELLAQAVALALA